MMFVIAFFLQVLSPINLEWLVDFRFSQGVSSRSHENALFLNLYNFGNNSFDFKEVEIGYFFPDLDQEYKSQPKNQQPDQYKQTSFGSWDFFRKSKFREWNEFEPNVYAMHVFGRIDRENYFLRDSLKMGFSYRSYKSGQILANQKTIVFNGVNIANKTNLDDFLQICLMAKRHFFNTLIVTEVPSIEHLSITDSLGIYVLWKTNEILQKNDYDLQKKLCNSVSFVGLITENANLKTKMLECSKPIINGTIKNLRTVNLVDLMSLEDVDFDIIKRNLQFELHTITNLVGIFQGLTFVVVKSNSNIHSHLYLEFPESDMTAYKSQLGELNVFMIPNHLLSAKISFRLKNNFGIYQKELIVWSGYLQ